MKTDVIHGEYDEYFEKIVEDIERQLFAGRATLIVFADKKKMQRSQKPSHVYKLSSIWSTCSSNVGKMIIFVLQVLSSYRCQEAGASRV